MSKKLQPRYFHVEVLNNGRITNSYYAKEFIANLVTYILNADYEKLIINPPYDEEQRRVGKIEIAN